MKLQFHLLQSKTSRPSLRMWSGSAAALSFVANSPESLWYCSFCLARLDGYSATSGFSTLPVLLV